MKVCLKLQIDSFYVFCLQRYQMDIISTRKSRKTGKMNLRKCPQKGPLMHEKCQFSELILVKLQIIADSEAQMYPLNMLKFWRESIIFLLNKQGMKISQDLRLKAGNTGLHLVQLGATVFFIFRGFLLSLRCGHRLWPAVTSWSQHCFAL